MPIVLAAALLSLLVAVVGAQEPAHRPGMSHPTPDSLAIVANRSPSPGQAAFGAIAEVVRLLDANPATDWRAVDIERLRQHLIDMSEVTLRAVVSQESVAGGASFVVTGSGRARDAIRRMAHAHGEMMGPDQDVAVTVENVTDGVLMTVVARTTTDDRAVARIRGLGFIGLLTTDDHHGPHHLGIAAGTMGSSHSP